MPQPPWHLNPNAPLDMDGQKITNLAAGVASDDAATVAQAGGGGGLPSQWVVGADGSLTINDDSLSSDFANAFLINTDGGAKQLFASDTGGDGNWFFTETGSSFIFSTAGGAAVITLDETGILLRDPGNVPTFQVGESTVAGLTSQLVLLDGLGTHTLEVVGADDGASSWIKFRANGPPAAIAARECGILFDPTNGAGALELQGKTLDGTSVTATIPMAHVQVLGWITEPPDGAAVRYDQANRALASAQQTALADLNLGTLTLLTDAITAIGTMQTKINSLLAKLRTAGVLAT